LPVARRYKKEAIRCRLIFVKEICGLTGKSELQGA
jgi:hypothetical protein